MFGLSLGDYEATIGVHKNGRTDILANEGGERSTPMMVTYGKSNMLVGTSSKQSLHRNFESTAVAMMKLLESNESDTKCVCEGLNCKVEFRDGKAHYCIPNVGLRTVQDSLSHLLKHLATTAHLCDSVSPIPVVIATSDVSEEKTSSLRQCAQECGFDVLGIYPSPLISVLAYGFGGPMDSFSGHILVYDMGASMLTLSLIKSDNGMLRKIHSQQFSEVGGAQLDKVLFTVLKAEGDRLFKRDVTGSNKRAFFKLLSATEQAKHSLSAQNTTNVYIESFFDGMDFQYSLSRGKFEGICLPVFKSFLEPMHSFIRTAGVSVNDIQKVVLVGGTCKIPKLQQLLRELFPSSELLSSISPDHVTAMGAAIQGRYISDLVIDKAAIPDRILCTPNNIVVKCSNCDDADPAPPLLLLVPSHTPLPCRRSASLSLKVTKDLILCIDSCDSIVLSLHETEVFSSDSDHTLQDGSTIAQIKVPISLVCVKDGYTKLQIDFIWKNTIEFDKAKVSLAIRDLQSEWRTEVELIK